MNLAADTTPPIGVAASSAADRHDPILHAPVDAMGRPVQAGGTSARLYNQDLAPTKAEGRRWTSYSIFTLWANDVHSLGNYGFAIGLFALGLGAWQILVALGVGAVLLFLLLTLSGFMGHKTGVPFPVMSRIAFGIHGAQLPALIRGGVAIVWFGIQTYLALLVLTVAVNLMANFVAPIYALTNLFPKKLNFRRASLVSAIIGLVILPWNLYNNPAVIVYFLGGLGALLGPLFGVIMADYWLIRKTRINVPELYSEVRNGSYFYRNGINTRAVAAFIPAAVLSLLIAFLPALQPVSSFSWFIGAGIGALAYFLIADRSRSFHDVSGEPIAVPSLH